jgi:NAD(P)-dependent dehydrogenase (short-subunit alcohol dehydrogenase family)
MLCSLENKVIAIPGGFGYLGSQVGRLAVSEGARVALIGRSRSKETFDESKVLSLSGVDLTDLEAANRAMTAIVDRFGRIDALIHTAGAFRFERLDSGDPAAWDQMYQQNLKTAVMSCKAVLSHLTAPGGRIVNVGAMASIKAAAGLGAYAASKSGVARLTESLADEVQARGITVNAVLPLTIDTPQNRIDMPKADFSKWTTPEAIAKVIFFLLSSESGAVTGALIPVYGTV